MVVIMFIVQSATTKISTFGNQLYDLCECKHDLNWCHQCWMCVGCQKYHHPRDNKQDNHGRVSSGWIQCSLVDDSTTNGRSFGWAFKNKNVPWHETNSKLTLATHYCNDLLYHKGFYVRHRQRSHGESHTRFVWSFQREGARVDSRHTCLGNRAKD